MNETSQTQSDLQEKEVRAAFERRFPDITYLELKGDIYVPRTNMTKYGQAIWSIAERQNCRFKGWQAAIASQAERVRAAETRSGIDAGNANSVVRQLAEAKEQVRKLEAFIALDDSMRNDYVKMRDQIKELESEVDQLKQGRTNSGDETSGTVARFGIDGTKIPLELIPATNGAFVWYSDYLKLYKQLAQSNETIKGLEAAASFWQEKCGKISEENVVLQARIEASDKQEPACYTQKGIFTDSRGRIQVSDRRIPVFIRPPITSERKLNLLAVIEQMRNDIKWYLESCDKEKVTHEFLIEHFSRSIDRATTNS